LSFDIKIIEEIKEYLEKMKVSSVRELVRTGHREKEILNVTS